MDNKYLIVRESKWGDFVKSCSSENLSKPGDLTNNIQWLTGIPVYAVTDDYFPEGKDWFFWPPEKKEQENGQ